MAQLDRHTRIKVTNRIEELLADNCRECDEKRIRTKTWTTVCESCPILQELRSCGQQLGFEPPADMRGRGPKTRHTYEPDLIIKAQKNGIPISLYKRRIRDKWDAKRAAIVPPQERKQLQLNGRTN